MLRCFTSIPQRVLALADRKLLQLPNHPLSIIKNMIFAHTAKAHPGVFTMRDDFLPKVTVTQNFDQLLIPKDHPSRRTSDTYYFDEKWLLRTHTSAHQIEMLEKHAAFLVAGDVFRRDEIDSKHYPCFHQMEGVRTWQLHEIGAKDYAEGVQFALKDLKQTLEQICYHVYGADIQFRWVEAYFPFTEPSLELEIYFQEEWMEVLGCGVIQRDVLNNANRSKDTVGWAYGLGLERWALKLFDIPDIRLFWSQDPRFTQQFSASKGISLFKPFSKYPVCYKDISFWLGPSFQENDLYELTREIAGDLVERVVKVDEFQNKQGRVSRCYRLHYRSMERSLTNEEVDALQFRLRALLPERLDAQLR